MIREAFQDLNRLRQIAQIAARHGFADLLERSGLSRTLGRKETTVEVSEEIRVQSLARRFRTLLAELGPTFIKLGQILSTRADLLPGAFIEELSTLQDSVSPIPLSEVEAEIRASLGKDPSQLFQSIEPQPLASASIAQVHRAVTLEGEPVVIKVQRPGIREQIRSDLSVLHYLARVLEAVVEETGIYRPVGIVDEFEKAILEELDFEKEAANVQAFYDNHRERPDFKIPKVYQALSSRTVLTLEFLSGVKVSQVRLEPEGRAQVARTIVAGAFRQLFEDGLVHGDPHPGNILVLEGNRVGLLDFGIVGRITPPMKETLLLLMLALALKDSESVARILYRLGEPRERASLAGFKRDIDTILQEYLGDTLGGINHANLIRDLLDLALKYKIRIPKEFAILSRASIALEGVLRSLYPELRVMEVALPYAKELLAGRYDLSMLQGGLSRTLFRLQTIASDLPTQLSQILLDLESGRFTVTVHSDQFEALNSNLRTVGVIGFLGFCACGFIVGAFISFTQTPWLYRGVSVLGVMGVAASAALFGSALTWVLFAGRVRKLRLSRLLGKRR